MDPLARLEAEFVPGDLGAPTPEALTARLTAYLATAQERVATPEQQYQHALSLALGGQIRVLLRKVEEFEATGDLKVKQGLAVRLAELRTDQADAARLAGVPVPGDVPLRGPLLAGIRLGGTGREPAFRVSEGLSCERTG